MRSPCARILLTTSSHLEIVQYWTEIHGEVRLQFNLGSIREAEVTLEERARTVDEKER